jgi:hypothetical protein
MTSASCNARPCSSIRCTGSPTSTRCSRGYPTATAASPTSSWCRSRVGWVERSETHRFSNVYRDGFRECSTHPTSCFLRNVQMSKLGLYAILGVIVSSLSLIGFVFIASTPMSQFRYAFVFIYIAATLCLFAFAARSLNTWSMVGLAFVVAIASVAAEQVLAFSRFSGLAKDLTLFGSDHLWRAGAILGIAVCWYLLVTFAATAITAKRRTPD